MNITLDNQKHLERFKKNPPHPSYISGFIDGDGCIFIRKITDGYQSGFTISQCRTNVLHIIRYHFGGTITSSTKRNDKINVVNENNNDKYFYKYNVRNQYNLIIRNNEYKILLNYLRNSFIIKEIQYQNLLEFSKIANLPNKKEEKEQLYLSCSECNKNCNLNNLCLERLNIEYISGLFDAEGCFFINKTNFNKFYISLSQKNHPNILKEIVKFLGFGNLSTNEFKIYKKTDCLKFIDLIKNKLIVKYNQAIVFQHFLETNNTEIKEEMYTICNSEKHEIEIFTELNQNDIGKESYLEKMKITILKEKICKEIQLKQFYKEKSEKMKGEGNYNFGKTFSQEIKQKMSNSIRDAKDSITDEMIGIVRELFENGYSNKDVQELLCLPRHTVSRIKNGIIICRNESKIEKKSLSQEEMNISKRKILLNEILVVIEKCIENMKPSIILQTLEKDRIQLSIENTLTIDIIKNIKRNIQQNKLPFYPCEMSDTKYNYYKDRISSYNEKKYNKNNIDL
jgi:hypothetical protein